MGRWGWWEIQAHGGITFAQDESTAKYDGMPRSAIAAGCVDYVLSPKDIAHELARIARHPYVFRDRGAGSAEIVAAGSAGLSSIFSMLRRSTGLDFTHYRQTTIVRRIHRRMVVHKIEKLDGYVKFLRENPAELKALYQDMLINVTSFFRNPRVFDALKSQIFPNILRNRAPESTIRMWTPGCASGEETYSLAILLLEFLGDKAGFVPVQLFGTDISESSISRARAGVYPENIRGDVSAERLRRYFTKTEGGYRISKSIRDMCIFAQHNLLNDPPFSQMVSDLLPQFADLSGAGAAEQSDFAVSLCDSRQRVSGAGYFGGFGTFDQPVRRRIGRLRFSRGKRRRGGRWFRLRSIAKWIAMRLGAGPCRAISRISARTMPRRRRNLTGGCWRNSCRRRCLSMRIWRSCIRAAT